MTTRGIKASVLAKRLGVSRHTIWRRIKEHKIPCIKLGPKTTIIPHADAERIFKYGLPIDS